MVLVASAQSTATTLRSEVVRLDLPLTQQMSQDELQAEFTSAEQLATAAMQQGGETSVEFRDARALSERWRRAIEKRQTQSLFHVREPLSALAVSSLTSICGLSCHDPALHAALHATLQPPCTLTS